MAIALGGLIGVTGAPACQKDPPKPSSDPPIVIGVSLGLSKDLGSFCQPLADTVRAAENEINAAGGVLGRQVSFQVIDDQSDEGDIVKNIANQFVQKNVAAVIGPAGSGQVVAVQDIYARAQTIEITPSATSTDLTNIQPTNNRFLYRTTPADDFQGSAVMLFATKTPRGLDADAGVASGGGDDDAGGAAAPPATCSNMTVVFIDNSYGHAMSQTINTSFPKLPPAGTRTVTLQQIPVAVQASYSDLATTIIATNPDCLALISYDQAAAQFVRDFKADPGYAALAAKGFFFIGTDGVYTPGFLTQSQTNPGDPTSASTAEGVFGTNPDTQPGTPEYNGFKTIYSSYYPIKSTDDAPPFAANVWDAAVLAAFAIEKAGSATDHVAIRNALQTVSSPPGQTISPTQIGDGLKQLRTGGDIDYKGASGNCDFQPNGNVNGGFIVWQAVRDASNKVSFKTVARFADSDLTAVLQ